MCVCLSVMSVYMDVSLCVCLDNQDSFHSNRRILRRSTFGVNLHMIPNLSGNSYIRHCISSLLAMLC